jgi:hypothetical protein
MSKQYPECPLYKHDNCREFHNPTLCAVVREDKLCIKKKQKQEAKANKHNRDGTGTASVSAALKENI